MRPQREVVVAVLAFLVIVTALGGTARGAGPPHPAGVQLLEVSSNGVSPPPTVSASAAYDAADGYVLMFGGLGLSQKLLDTTWAFSRGNWSEISPVGGLSPPPRYQAQMAFDAADGYILLFGGCGDVGCQTPLADTWAYAHGRWTDLTGNQTAVPPARDRGAMVDDTGDGYVYLFGGVEGSGPAYLNDSWTFRSGHWSSRSVPGSIPSGRAGPAMAYDAATNETWLFGGNSATGVLADTWVYRSGAWTNLTSTMSLSPSARWVASATYDSESRVGLLVNGYNHGTLLDDTWWFQGSSWVRVDETGGPLPTYGGLLVDDPSDGYVVYFSGSTTNSALFTSTFVYTPAGWQLLINPPGSPSGASLLFIAAPLLIVPVLFLVTIPLGNRARRRWEGKLATGVTLAPGERVRWVETPASQRALGPAVTLAVMLIVLPAAFLVPLALGGIPLGSLLLIVGVVGVLYGGTGVLLVRSSTGTNTRAVGVVEGGVIVRRRLGELRVAWENLQPSVLPPRRGRYWFQFLVPGRQQGVGGFGVTVEQARSILLDPRAPSWPLSRAVSSGLGLPAQTPLPRAGSTRPAPTARPGPLAPEPPLPAGAPAGAAVPSWTPPPPPNPSGAPTPWTPARSPVAPRRPVATPPPVAPPTPSPWMVTCRACGQTNPKSGVAFCRNCGHRLF